MSNILIQLIYEKLVTLIGSANVATILVENHEFHDLLMEQDSPSKTEYATSDRTNRLADTNLKSEILLRKTSNIFSLIMH